MPIWFIPFAMTQQLYSAKEASLTFEPNLPCPYVLPVLVTGAIGTLSCHTKNGPSVQHARSPETYTMRITLGSLNLTALAVGSNAHSGPVDLKAGQAVTW